MPETHPDTGEKVYDCSRCGNTINPNGRPIEETAVYYIEAADERNPMTVDTAVALKHTDDTRSVRDAVVDRDGISIERANDVLARQDRGYLYWEPGKPSDVGKPEWTESVGDGEVVVPPMGAYVREKFIDPEVKKHDNEVVKIVSDTVTVDRPAYLFVDPECLEDDDVVQWSGHSV